MERFAAPSIGEAMNFQHLPDRGSFLRGQKDLKMARSAHAYVRGNTARFYEWLAESHVSQIVPQGPAVWICGDCHLGNLGPLADGDGKVAIQIRDHDQAVIGNPAHDLIRLGLSLATAARGSDLPGVVTARMIEAMVDGYEAAFAEPGADDADAPGKGDEPAVVRTVRRRALGRKWRHLARERLEDIEPSIPLGKRFWPLDAAQRASLEAIIAHPPVSAMILSFDREAGATRPVMADAAYWVKGCSSLGLWRFAVIVELKGDKRRDFGLIDLKEATIPVAPVAPGAVMPANHAERVVAAARALSPHLGERMATADCLGHAMFMRELTPQDLKIEVDQFSRGEALKAARYLALVVGRAHARQMDKNTRRDWMAVLQRGRSGGMDAPSWLWQAVVAMAARHEAGYLDHCRRYALTH
jgi:uncharacterized protein (DUF2252 family)